MKAGYDGDADSSLLACGNRPVTAAPTAGRQVRLAGPFQQLVLLALTRLGPDTPASVIRRHIAAGTGRRISITAVHTTLRRLEGRGYSRSWLRPIIRQRRFGPGWWKRPLGVLPLGARRLHSLQMLGRRALRLTLQAEDVLRPGLPGLGREELLYTEVTPRLSSAPRHWWEGLPLNRRLRRLLDAWAADFAPPPEWLRLKLPRALRPPPAAPAAA